MVRGVQLSHLKPFRPTMDHLIWLWPYINLLCRLGMDLIFTKHVSHQFDFFNQFYLETQTAMRDTSIPSVCAVLVSNRIHFAPLVSYVLS